MKGIASLLLLILFAATAQAQNGYTIQVKIKNTVDTVAYLGYPYGDKKYVQDTARVQKGNIFTFHKKDTLETGIYFVYTPNNIYFEIIADNQEIYLETDTTDLVKNLKVKGSQGTQLFRDFQLFMKNSQQEAGAISEKMKADKANEEQYREQLRALDKKVKDYRQQLIENNSDLFVAKLIKATVDIEVPEGPKDSEGNELDPTFRYQYYKSHFFDNVDFSEPGMLRTPIFHQKITEYLDKLTYKHPDSIVKAAHFIIEKARANKEVFRYCVVSISNKYETSNIMGMDAVFVDLAQKYYLTGQAYWADDDLVEKIGKRVRELKPLIGDKAPEIIALDVDENPVSMYAIDADYVVLYFYDPDCGHCKKETPKLQKLYETKLLDMGVEVFAASTNTDMEKWEKFIDDHNLTFINVADPYTQSNFRADYYVDRTPKLFVVDRNKKIIAKRLEIDQLEDFISKQKELSKAN